MGINYTVWPLDAQMKDWLTGEDVAFPDVPSRWPLGKEIRSALDRLSDISIRYNENGIGRIWQAGITEERDDGFWTYLNILEYQGPDNPNEPYFEKGHPELIVAIIRDLSLQCGPLAVVSDAGDPPVIVGQHEPFAVTVDRMVEVDTNSDRWLRLLGIAPGARD
jgi:hypothetical protein